MPLLPSQGGYFQPRLRGLHQRPRSRHRQRPPAPCAAHASARRPFARARHDFLWRERRHRAGLPYGSNHVPRMMTTHCYDAAVDTDSQPPSAAARRQAVPLAEYGANLRTIIRRLRARVSGKPASRRRPVGFGDFARLSAPAPRTPAPAPCRLRVPRELDGARTAGVVLVVITPPPVDTERMNKARARARAHAHAIEVGVGPQPHPSSGGGQAGFRRGSARERAPERARVSGGARRGIPEQMPGARRTRMDATAGPSALARAGGGPQIVSHGLRRRARRPAISGSRTSP